MEQDSVGYLLGALDEDAHAEFEAFLAEHPESNGRLNRFRRALEPLASDKDSIEPADDLAMRTIAFVAAHITHTEEREEAAGNSPVADFIRSLSRRETQLAQTPVYPWRGDETSPPQRRRRDFVAAIGLTTAVLLVGGAGILNLRQASVVQACQNNLRGLHQGLNVYCDTRGDDRLPQVTAKEDVRTTLVNLQRTCARQDHQTDLTCPGATHNATGLPPIDYAYNLGYWDADGQLHGLKRRADQDLFPILADCPDRRDDRSFPINHRKGQNVLFVGGNVQFTTHPNVGPKKEEEGDDIFFNQDRKPNAGKQPFDCVLGCANDTP